MRFIILPSSTVPIHAKILDERPLGGTETGIVRLAASLADLGHDVTVFTQLRNPPLSKPLYLPLSQLAEVKDTDVLIVVREWLPLFCDIKAKRRLFWTGDAVDQSQTYGLGDGRVVKRADALLAVSEWHAESLCRLSGFPRDKAVVIRNGIVPDLFRGEEVRNPRRMIYSSTPFRGLSHLPNLFRAIKAKVADAELAIFSSYDVYAETIGGIPQGYDGLVSELDALKREFATIPGVHYSGGIRQAELARQFMRSAVLAYPNTFAETSCITVMEAQAAGCVPLTSNLGALPETVGASGVLLEGLPGTSEYNARFVDEAARLLTDSSYWAEKSSAAKKMAESASWNAVALRLMAALKDQGLE